MSTPEDYTPLGYANGGYTYWTDYLFQAVFCATAGIIVSGAVTERIKISAYFVFTVFLTGLTDPILGWWMAERLWVLRFRRVNRGTLSRWLGCAGSGNRTRSAFGEIRKRENQYISKFVGTPGHAGFFFTLVRLVWIQRRFRFIRCPGNLSLVCVTTGLAAATGGIGALFSGLLDFKRSNLGMIRNGFWPDLSELRQVQTRCCSIKQCSSA